ncbi:hypothetical protein FQN51_008101 [Onygenales sp. PD_10]|nr:hypothetical protein FQN51_008101 [Onygenales sp. PD_10]
MHKKIAGQLNYIEHYRMNTSRPLTTFANGQKIKVSKLFWRKSARKYLEEDGINQGLISSKKTIKQLRFQGAAPATEDHQLLWTCQFNAFNSPLIHLRTTHPEYLDSTPIDSFHRAEEYSFWKNMVLEVLVNT